MRPSRTAPARSHGDWRGPRAEAARRRDDAEQAASVVAPALAALRSGREAVIEIDGQLDEVLEWVSDRTPGRSSNPGRRPPRDLADRLAASSRRAGEALTGLGALLYDDGPAGSELF